MVDDSSMGVVSDGDAPISPHPSRELVQGLGVVVRDGPLMVIADAFNDGQT